LFLGLFAREGYRWEFLGIEEIRSAQVGMRLAIPVSMLLTWIVPWLL